MNTFEHVLTGLDGANPLAFFAALGTLRVLHEHAQDAHLRWELRGNWTPILRCSVSSIAELCSLLERDRELCTNDLALDLTYGEDGNERDLKAPLHVFAEYLEKLATSATPENRRSVDWGAAFGSEIIADGQGKAVKPTALHFTAGQQKFLQMVRDIHRGITAEDIHEALVGPWQSNRPLAVMNWDATVTRDYALRAKNPSGDKKLGNPGADWLAIRGLAAFPCFPVGTQLRTTGCWGGWKNGGFGWPLWTGFVSWNVACSIIGSDWSKTPGKELAARKIGALFSSAIKRSDQGGYGNFSPARDAREKGD